VNISDPCPTSEKQRDRRTSLKSSALLTGYLGTGEGGGYQGHQTGLEGGRSERRIRLDIAVFTHAGIFLPMSGLKVWFLKRIKRSLGRF